MKQKIILITGIMVFGLSACGSHEDEKIIKAEYEETEQVNEQVIEPETEQELSSETVADSMTETPEDEAVSVYSDDYGEYASVVKEFTNNSGKKTYYYELNEFYFSDEKYAKVNTYLQKMYQQYVAQYEDYATKYTGDYEMNEEEGSVGPQCDYSFLVYNGIAFADDDYVSLQFNDTLYFAGSIHPMSCISPVTIRIRTGEEVTPEEVLGKTWEEIRKEGAIEEKSEENFNQDYGFYLTDTELCYVYRFNYFVDEIRIPR